MKSCHVEASQRSLFCHLGARAKEAAKHPLGLPSRPEGLLDALLQGYLEGIHPGHKALDELRLLHVLCSQALQ